MKFRIESTRKGAKKPKVMGTVSTIKVGKATRPVKTEREALRAHGCNISLTGRGKAVHTTKRGTKIRAFKQV